MPRKGTAKLGSQTLHAEATCRRELMEEEGGPCFDAASFKVIIRHTAILISSNPGTLRGAETEAPFSSCHSADGRWFHLEAYRPRMQEM